MGKDLLGSFVTSKTAAMVIVASTNMNIAAMAYVM